MEPKIPYLLRRSSRKTISLEIDSSGRVLVRAPEYLSQEKIRHFVEVHRDWIRRKQEKWQMEHFCLEEEGELRRRAAEILPQKTAVYAARMGLQPSGVRITSARTRLGSCSPKNRICYSWRLIAWPEEAVDYVVVHELAHILYKNHGQEFYALIARVLPDYKERIRLLQQGPLPPKKSLTKGEILR